MFRDREVHIQDHRGAVLQEAVVRALIQGQLIRPVFTARAHAPVHVHVLVLAVDVLDAVPRTCMALCTSINFLHLTKKKSKEKSEVRI